MLVIAFVLPFGIVNAQFNIPGKIQNKVNNRINNKIDRGIDKGLDEIEKGVKGDNKKDDKTQSDDKNDKQASDDKTGNDKTQSGKSDQPSLQSYSKYDFIPGEKVIFYEDFSQDAVGDFPALWNTNGTAEVVTTNLYPGNWMKLNSECCVWTDKLLNLPDNYTIEFDAVPIEREAGKGMYGWHMRLMQARNVTSWDAGTAPGKGGFCLTTYYYGKLSYNTWLYGECDKQNLSGFVEEQYQQKLNKKIHFAMWIQKSRIRVYQEQDKIVDLPRAFPAGCVKPDRLRFEYGAVMVSNIRIAVGAPDMRNKLMTEGKLVTYGIYFDVNKDVVKPESYGTLKEIANILNEVPDVKVKIVGHTDSDGADASNLDLSKRRAASVKNELVKNFNVNGDRLVTDGMGESQPVAPNDTPANKALNRRVEFIKM
jgi:outer membrane protein OmpA-like peptidoglycan-associated protein